MHRPFGRDLLNQKNGPWSDRKRSGMAAERVDGEARSLRRRLTGDAERSGRAGLMGVDRLVTEVGGWCRAAGR